MRQRGARPSPRHRLAAARPHRITEGEQAPSQFLWLPVQLSMWLNDVDGDCVTAEEAFAKACNQPEIFISDSTVQSWATALGVLNGTDLVTVLDAMQTAGFSQDGTLYNDGPAVTVDWTNDAELQNAIWKGPVKIGVAGTQLESAVPEPPRNGWLATGFSLDQNEDHCVSLCGYGSLSWLVTQLGDTFPGSVVADGPGYAMFTWDSIGVIDRPSLLAICGEAWLRNPTTIIAASA